MTTVREKRIKEMQESMDRLQREYGEERPAKKKKAKTKGKKVMTKKDAPFSVFGLVAKIRKRKARNRKSIQD